MPRRLCTAIALALLLIPQAPVRAQDVPVARAMRIARISPWVDDQQPFRLTAQITNQAELALEDVEIHVTFFARVTSRSQLRDTVDDLAPRQVAGSLVERVEAAVEPGEQMSVSILRDADELAFLASGVYPIEITLQHADGRESVRTAIPSFTSEPAGRLNLVWILPVNAPIVTPPDNIYPPDVIETLGLDRMLQQMEAIADHPSAGITLAPRPALLDTLASLAGGFAVHGTTGPVVLAEGSSEVKRARAVLDAIRAAADAGELVAPPYAPVDIPALAAHGLADDMVRQVTLGRATLESRLGLVPAEGFLASGGADSASARMLIERGVDAYVLPATSLARQPAEPFNPELFGPSRPVSIRAGTGEARVLLPDPAMSARVDTSPEGVLLGQTLIAETASAWFELPLHASERVLVIASEKLPSPVALRTVLDGFTRGPWIRLRTASDALTTLEPQEEPTELLAVRTRDRAALVDARAARSRLRTLSAITLEPLDEAPALDRLVLLSESRVSSIQDGRALARAVSTRIRAIFRNIGVAKSSPVTMTSKRDEVPVTITNNNLFPIRVRVKLESPKLRFPQGAVLTREVVPPRERIDVTVEAQAAGSFPLDVLVQTPDGTRVLARGRLTVRSTTISAVALIVVGGSLGLLLFSWARKNTRRRRTAAVR